MHWSPMIDLLFFVSLSVSHSVCASLWSSWHCQLSLFSKNMMKNEEKKNSAVCGFDSVRKCWIWFGFCLCSYLSNKFLTIGNILTAHQALIEFGLSFIKLKKCLLSNYLTIWSGKKGLKSLFICPIFVNKFGHVLNCAIILDFSSFFLSLE